MKHILVIFSLTLMVMGMWVSSGNLSPYAATLPNPNSVDSKGNLLDSTDYALKKAAGEKTYIVNYDHMLYKANYHMLNVDPRETWGFNIVQRRILYYVLAFQFMKLFGFLTGGFIATILITLIALLYAYQYINKKYGTQSGLFFLLLMSTYPGIMYWCGTSFAQVAIVPLSLCLYIHMLMYDDISSKENALRISIIFGIGFLAYDLAAYFIPATILLFCYKKQWKHLGYVILMIVPSVLLNLFYLCIGLSFVNDNTSVYTHIFLSYFNMDFNTFILNLKEIPMILYHNYIDSQFLYLGILGLFLCCITLFFTRKNISFSGVALSISILFIFLFNNLAPAYEGWMIKGTWIARIYQPFFVVIVFTVVSLLKNTVNRFVIYNMVRVAVVIVFVLNAYVVFSPINGDFDWVTVYERFYQHAPPGTMEHNIKKYGSRPLGL